MKKLLIPILTIICFFQVSLSQEKGVLDQKDYSASVVSIDAIINNLYAVISGEKEQERDWDHFRYLFHANAKLIPAGKNPEGTVSVRYLSPLDYIKTSGAWLVSNGFFEVEIYREVQQFGKIAHVLSTYQAYQSAGETVPFLRGINSIQLLNDGERWWILNVYWTQESESQPIPKQYLPNN